MKDSLLVLAGHLEASDCAAEALGRDALNTSLPMQGPIPYNTTPLRREEAPHLVVEVSQSDGDAFGMVPLSADDQPQDENQSLSHYIRHESRLP